MPQLDMATYASQFFWLCISFFTMLFIMSKFIVPKISDILSQRQRKVDDYISAATEFKQSAEAVWERYEQALEKANFKADMAMKHTQDELNKFIEQSEKDADKKLNKKLKESEKELKLIQDNIFSQIESLSMEFGEFIVKKIGIEEIKREDLEKIVRQETTDV
jgi:F-type H+-transporting ATPase subunit b